ncbi:MAG: hybrid sensor histidine kinase/response regulator [Calditrichaeota bacterium]|nr:MAG: hybrid sensor histidine kinase/response regulator [Calditrichota bacterium]
MPAHLKKAALFLLFYSSLSVFFQERNFRFSHLTTDHGLSQSNVTCILQDSKGFMWIGTFNGLNRFDGYNFETFHYRQDDPNSLSHNYISALLEDRSGNLWVGTSDGLNRYDRMTGRFSSFKHQSKNPASLSDNPVESLLEDSRGRLWIGLRNGIVELFDPATETFTHFIHDPDNPNSITGEAIRILFQDSEENLWITYHTGNIDIITFQDSTAQHFSVSKYKLANAPVTGIVESPDQKIWLSTQGEGLYCLKFDADEIKEIAHYTKAGPRENGISSNILLSLELDSLNKLWIGAEDEGISILDLATNTFEYCQHNPFIKSSLKHDSVWDIYEDRAGNMWIGTYAYGVNLLTDRKTHFQHYYFSPKKENGLSHNIVNALLEDREGKLWIATDGGGLNLFDKKTYRFSHITTQNSTLGTDVIVSLLNDRSNRLWIGTWTRGLYRYDKTTGRFTHFSKENYGLGSARILHITEDQNGGLWLATYLSGLTYFNADSQRVRVFNTQNSALSDDYVRVTLQDSFGALWIGTDVGVDVYDASTNSFIHHKHDEHDENSLSKGFVNWIMQSRDSTIWIGSTGGLNKFDRTNEHFTHYTTKEGLPNDEIKCIVEDNDGILWLSTNKGLSQFDVNTGTFKNFDVSDGLQGNEFNSRSGLSTSEGEIAFGGANGFNLFHPPIHKENDFIPPVVLTDFKLFNESLHIGSHEPRLDRHISETQHITLAYNHNVFSIDFVTLNYAAPERNQYAYKMEGFDTKWIYAGATRTATYTNLDPGDYLFRVKASNNTGLWNESGTSLKITITTPFWQTWWFYSLEVFAVLAVFAFIINYFISRQRLQHALKMEHLELEKMYEMDQIKTQFFTNIAHEFHSPLTLILSPLEKLITTSSDEEKTKNSLQLIHRNARRLQRMTNQLKDFQKMETDDLKLTLSQGDIIAFIKDTVSSFNDYANNRGIQFQWSSSHNEAFTWFDADKVDKIIYNLLSNAFKFTPDTGKIKVAVTVILPAQDSNHDYLLKKADRYIEICVQDNGIGIPRDKVSHVFERFYRVEESGEERYDGSGIGLAFVSELVKLYGGEIAVFSKEEAGSTFTVHLPLDEKYLEENQLIGDFSIADVSLSNTLDRNEDQIFPMHTQSDAAAFDLPVVLIVDDDKETRNYIQASLQSKFRTICAENGMQGIDKAIETIPDLIISDVKMPATEGTGLCSQLKNDERTSHIPIILLTAHSSHKDKIQGLAAGADVYLTKPFNIDELEAHVINLTQSRRKLRAKFSHGLDPTPKRSKLTAIDEQFLQRIDAIIAERLGEPELNAELLAKEAGMSRMQLYRKIKGLTNQTVHELIRSIRLKKAAALLQTKQKTITEVAYEVGFNDLTYFARCFRKLYQKSPSEFLGKKK